jgi:hypothetical protein
MSFDGLGNLTLDDLRSKDLRRCGQSLGLLLLPKEAGGLLSWLCLTIEGGSSGYLSCGAAKERG